MCCAHPWKSNWCSSIGHRSIRQADALLSHAHATIGITPSVQRREVKGWDGDMVRGSFLPWRRRAQAAAGRPPCPQPPVGSSAVLPTPCRVLYETHPRVLRDPLVELPPYDGGYQLPANTEHACLNDARTTA